MSPDSLYFIVGLVFVVVIGIDVISWLKDHKIVAPEIRIKKLWKKLTYSVFILGITTLIAAILLNVNILDYRSPMPYASIDAITLKDFRGFKLPNQTLDGMTEFAFITTSLAFERSEKEVTVNSYFHPSRSYVYNDRIVDRSLLRHELYHFRVTEVFARKCRKELRELDQIPDNNAIDKIVESNWDAEREMQFRYDDESYHGYIMKEQKRWEKEIDSLLTLLIEYKNPAIRYE